MVKHAMSMDHIKFQIVVGLVVFAPVVFAGSNPTFYKDILPILQQHCQSCHRPGEIGPMALVTYAQARAKAKLMEPMVRAKKMPPWFADPRYGHFANDPSLTAKEVETITAWVREGTPA